jgi:hypothetical protein
MPNLPINTGYCIYPKENFMETSNESPLKKYRRQPKLFIDLPSKGKYSPSGTVYNDVYTQLAVFSMTANDEILFKTPDALVNGEATAKNINSCIPSIIDPWRIPTIDLDTILIAIRMATYGNTMRVQAQCPHCKEKNAYDVDLQKLLEYYATLDYQDVISVDNFVFHLKPLNYKQLTDSKKTSVQLSRAINQQAPNIEDEESRNEFVDTILQKIAEEGVKIIFLTIDKVEVDGEAETDKNEIMEFLQNQDVSVFKAIKAHIEHNSKKWRTPNQKVVCGNEACGKEHNIALSLDQSDFFGIG